MTTQRGLKIGDDYICTGVNAQPLPVPRVCPECGAKTVRVGNRHHREVYCGSTEQEWCEGLGFPVKKCRWRAGVYRLTAACWPEGCGETSDVAAQIQA